MVGKRIHKRENLYRRAITRSAMMANSIRHLVMPDLCAHLCQLINRCLTFVSASQHVSPLLLARRNAVLECMREVLPMIGGHERPTDEPDGVDKMELIEFIESVVLPAVTAVSRPPTGQQAIACLDRCSQALQAYIMSLRDDGEDGSDLSVMATEGSDPSSDSTVPDLEGNGFSTTSSDNQ